MTTIADLQTKFLDKLDVKIKGSVNRASIKKALTQHSYEGRGEVMTVSDFTLNIEKAGNALSKQELMFLFSYWDSRAGQLEPCGKVPIPLAVDDLVESMVEYKSAVFKSGDDPFDKGAKGNFSNKSSQEGGIFGGGAFEADARGDGSYRAAPPGGGYAPPGALPGGYDDGYGEAAPSPTRAAPLEGKPRGNQSSIQGGIFGQDESGPPSSRGGGNGGNKSNRSSVEGGIFAEGPPVGNAPRANKPYSNQSSIPGGIFG